jgi:hypothetical protein
MSNLLTVYFLFSVTICFFGCNIQYIYIVSINSIEADILGILIPINNTVLWFHT